METMMINFQTEDRKKDHEMLKKNFEEATLEHYGHNFDASSAKYYNLKLEILRILEKLCIDYMDRTKELLAASSTDNKTIDIFIHYSKGSSFFAYFKKPADPVRDISPYNEDFPVEDFHYFYDLKRLENYLKNGHFNYVEAKRLYNDPVVAFYKNKKKILPNELDYIIDRYLYVIRHCRYAKQFGIEIYKLKNKFKSLYFLDQYDLRKSQFTPIFDDRIPEKFIIDAVDNAKLLYPQEVAKKKKIEEKIGGK
jgi:hypothetical protein